MILSVSTLIHRVHFQVLPIACKALLNFSTKTMAHRIIHLNNGVDMPILGLGTYKIRGDAVKMAVDCALRHGYRSIDTAAYYGNEEEIGQTVNNVISELGLERKDIFVTTKLPPSHHGAIKCEEIFNTSLTQLNLSYIDLYLIHWPGANGHPNEDNSIIKMRRETWLTMEKLYAEGKVRAIGVSNYTMKHLEELLSFCTVKPAVNQVECHPHLTQKELFDFCNSRDIHLQAYSSLGTSSSTELLKNEVVNDIAKKLNKSAAQILLRWGIQQGIGVIPKASTPEHIKSNYQLWDFSISDEDMALLNSLNESKHYCWDPETVI